MLANFGVREAAFREPLLLGTRCSDSSTFWRVANFCKNAFRKDKWVLRSSVKRSQRMETVFCLPAPGTETGRYIKEAMLGLAFRGVRAADP